jgi:hypothetical protein
VNISHRFVFTLSFSFFSRLLWFPVPFALPLAICPIPLIVAVSYTHSWPALSLAAAFFFCFLHTHTHSLSLCRALCPFDSASRSMENLHTQKTIISAFNSPQNGTLIPCMSLRNHTRMIKRAYIRGTSELRWHFPGDNSRSGLALRLFSILLPQPTKK